MRSIGKDIQLDYLGAISITGALVAFVYGVSETGTNGWGSWTTFWSLLIAAVLFIAFIALETCYVAQPLVPFGLFQSRALLGANIVIMFIGVGMFCMFFFISLWLQRVAGLNAVETGLTFLPQTVGIGCGAVLAGKLSPKYGPRIFLLLGTFIATFGMLWLSFVTWTDDYFSGVCGGGIVTAFGIGKIRRVSPSYLLLIE